MSTNTEAATSARTAQNAQARADRIEDINFMIANGVSNEAEVAHRLGLTLASFERWCYRTGNAELWNRLIAYRAIQRDDWKGDRSLLRPRKDTAA